MQLAGVHLTSALSEAPCKTLLKITMFNSNRFMTLGSCLLWENKKILTNSWAGENVHVPSGGDDCLTSLQMMPNNFQKTVSVFMDHASLKALSQELHGCNYQQLVILTNLFKLTC